MGSFITQFSPAQITLLTSRTGITVRQAQSTTGYVVAGDDPGEFYIDDVNALFATNNVQVDDIVAITAGGSTPLGYYSVTGLYYDPAVDASVALPFEDRLICNGYPLAAGPVTYKIYAGNEILLELAMITENKSRVINVTNPALQILDDFYVVFHNQFNTVCNFVSDEHVWLNWQDRTRVTPTLINTSATATSNTELFPETYFGLNPNRSPSYPLGGSPPFTYPAIDPFDVTLSNPNLSERKGVDDEEAEGLGPLDTLNGAYNDALDREEDSLNNQDAILTGLAAEIAANDSIPEAGTLSAYYTAMSASVAAAKADIVKRLADIAQMRSANRARPYAGCPNYTSYAAARAAIDARATQLENAPYATFNDLRYIYLDLLVNRSYGTRTEIVANNTFVAIEDARQVVIIQDLNTERALQNLAAFP